jgi:hypothetical protein
MTQALNLANFANYLNSAGQFSSEAIQDGTITSTNITYNEGSTGAITRTVEERLQDYVSVKDFGALGDSTTDDTVAIQAAIDSLSANGGLVYFPAGKYVITNTISIDLNYITLQGDGNNVSWIKVVGSNIDAIYITGVSGTPRRNIMIRDMSIISNTAGSTNTGILLQYTAFVILQRMQIHDFINGLTMQGATNTQLDTIGATYNGGSNNFIGFNIYGGTSAADANASSNFTNCYSSGIAGRTGQIGFRVSGVYMSDLQFNLCETALTNYGYVLDYSLAPDYNVDIIIRNPIVDRYFIQGILVNELPSNGTLSIIGGYTNPEVTGAVAQNIYFLDCTGTTTIVGHQFQALGTGMYAYTTGLYAENSNNIIVNSSSFNGLLYGIEYTSVGYSQIIGNTFNNSVHAATKMIKIIGGARVMVNGNSFNGYATQGVSMDGTSSGCGIVGNTANISIIGIRYLNSGSGPIGGSDGATGLNSGA